MNNQWKFNIGEIVKPTVQTNYEHASKMLVLARTSEEWAGYTRRAYLCSHMKLGEMARQVFEELELEAFASHHKD